MKKQHIPTYTFDSKYVSGRALTVLERFEKNNQAILKTSTGIGGTTAMLNQTQTRVIIISPNVSQIKGKEQKKHDYGCRNTLFIYGDSMDRWRSVSHLMDTDNQFVVMTTPDQLMMLKKNDNDLYKKLLHINLFIDENHQMVKDFGYRKVMKDLFIAINTEWKASYKLSTATPLHQYGDIPDDVDIIKIGRKQRHHRDIYYSEKQTDYKLFVEQQLALGRRVIVFSNDSRVYRYLASQYRGIVHYGASSNLTLKVRRWFENFDINYSFDEITDMQKFRIFILSSSYFSGYDLDFSASVVFISNPKSESSNFDLVDFIQGKGRVRMELFDVLLVNCGLSPKGKQRQGSRSMPYNPPTTPEELKRALQLLPSKKNDLDFEHRCSKMKLLNEFNFFNKEAREEELNRAGLKPVPYQTSVKIRAERLIGFGESMVNILALPHHMLHDMINQQIRHNIYGKSGGNITGKDAIFYYGAYLIKKYFDYDDSYFEPFLQEQQCHGKILSSMLKYSNPEWYNTLPDLIGDTFPLKQGVSNRRLHGFGDESIPSEREIMDFVLLYCGNYRKQEDFTMDLQRDIEIYLLRQEKVEVWKLYETTVIPKIVKGITKYEPMDENQVRAIIDKMERWTKKQLKVQNLVLTTDEAEKMEEAISKNVRSINKLVKEHAETCKEKPQTKITLPINRKKEHIYKIIHQTCFVLFAEGRGSLTQYKKFRGYNALTSLPSFLRNTIPIKYESIDIVQAHATFVHQIFNIPNIPIYDNLVLNRVSLGGDKDKKKAKKKAKILYNTMLNHDKMGIRQSHLICMQAGYPREVSNKIANWTNKSGKGVVSLQLTEMEEDIIKVFVNQNTQDNNLHSNNFIRFHDAVIIQSYLLRHDPELTMLINGVKFERKPFNYKEPIFQTQII